MAVPNITNYLNKKTKNLINIQKIDSENYAIATKQFSSEDGIEQPSQVIGCTVTETDKAIADKQKELDNLKAFKADLLAAV